MNILKRTRLTLLDRQQMWLLYQTTGVEGSTIVGTLPRQSTYDR